MANQVQAQVLGGAIQSLDGVGTVREVKERLGAQNHTATVNGRPTDDNAALRDYEFVALAPAVKGGK